MSTSRLQSSYRGNGNNSNSGAIAKRREKCTLVITVYPGDSRG